MNIIITDLVYLLRKIKIPPAHQRLSISVDRTWLPSSPKPIDYKYFQLESYTDQLLYLNHV